MLRPDFFLGEIPRGSSQPVRSGVDQVCEYIMSYYALPITLTDLELLAGISGRALQYAFLKRFACTPMQWLRQQRLNALHRCLSSPQPHDTVTSVALDCGLTNLSNLATLYKQAFGEYPSQTLEKARIR